jgi:hypothetical protein
MRTTAVATRSTHAPLNLMRTRSINEVKTSCKLVSKSSQLVCTTNKEDTCYSSITSVYSHSDGSMTGRATNKFGSKVKVTYNIKLGTWEY